MRFITTAILLLSIFYIAMPQSIAMATCEPGHVGEMTEADLIERAAVASTSLMGTVRNYRATSAIIQFEVEVDRFINGSGPDHFTFVANQNTCYFIVPQDVREGERVALVLYNEQYGTAYVGQWMFYNGRIVPRDAGDNVNSWTWHITDAASSGLVLAVFTT
ncbi:MAG: hypothetical protein AAFR56_19420, partial [Chloroflexota bacterium]